MRAVARPLDDHLVPGLARPAVDDDQDEGDDRAEHASRRLERLESLREFLENREDNLSVYGRITLEYGLRLGEAQLEWAK
ncbi:hypothetical protein [Spongiactinospora sp. TRM90649]|uniref:hypothetical protein n=1 Tax=Spongiactinospora sp. TRM90649 TaxID=3031114 RepID=UPI0023F9CFF2|nr:hypothetical protein [Spongiactinospora sp. TRM90649]MDF5753973.1 hypothetical protein [Spongiactinospora sp. TRM90649]